MCFLAFLITAMKVNIAQDLHNQIILYFPGNDNRLREAKATVFTDDECYGYWERKERYGIYNPSKHICVGVVGKVGACMVSNIMYSA